MDFTSKYFDIQRNHIVWTTSWYKADFVLDDIRQECPQIKTGIGSLHGRGEEPAQHHENGKQPRMQLPGHLLRCHGDLVQQKLIQAGVVVEEGASCLAAATSTTMIITLQQQAPQWTLRCSNKHHNEHYAAATSTTVNITLQQQAPQWTLCCSNKHHNEHYAAPTSTILD